MANGGQARIEGADGAFDAVKINFADPSLGFTKLIFNLIAWPTQLQTSRRWISSAT